MSTYAITPGPVDWFAVDFGGHVHEGLEVETEVKP